MEFQQLPQIPKDGLSPKERVSRLPLVGSEGLLVGRGMDYIHCSPEKVRYRHPERLF